MLLLLQPKCIPGLEGRWLGATDITTEGKFIWESGRPFTYHNWSQPGPDNSEGIENCAVMYCNYGQWNDLNCVNNHVNTLCEINFPCTSGLRTPAYLHVPRGMPWNKEGWVSSVLVFASCKTWSLCSCIMAATCCRWWIEQLPLNFLT